MFISVYYIIYDTSNFLFFFSFLYKIVSLTNISHFKWFNPTNTNDNIGTLCNQHIL